MMMLKRTFLWSVLIALIFLFSCKENSDYDVLIVGGGASGSMAGIQSARLGAKTLIVEEGPWLGGMLTSAGVSAIDGNYKLYSGLWEEFRQNLYDYYGGAEGVRTGWVSHVLFEPSVGAEILKKMADHETNLEVKFGHRLVGLVRHKKGWIAEIEGDNQTFKLRVKVVIDGTELGDVAAMCGVSYDVGMDSRHDTGELIAPEEANNIIQDLTYVVILKDFGPGSDMTIPKPENYDPTPFLCACAGVCNPDSVGRILWDCDYMLDYGKLPNGKYMINWPIYGNDYYINPVEMSHQERLIAYEEAKWFTRCFIYYIQAELGFVHLGIDFDEFPTKDGFPLIPYHRESRRIHGLVRFGINDLSEPFSQKQALYRTGIAVGDYPIDHHHHAYKGRNLMPELYFYPVPSYSIPLGSLIPKSIDYLVVAEKSISVTNIVNGTTRLQPVTILIGQAAGTLAALAVKLDLTPGEVPVRMVQRHLLQSGAYIMPYSDVTPNDKFFESVQRIGATGLVKGEGKNVGWENFTFFYPDSIMTSESLADGLKELFPQFMFQFSSDFVSLQEVLEMAVLLADEQSVSSGEEDLRKRAEKVWEEKGFGLFIRDKKLTRAQVAVLMDELVNPFDNLKINHFGEY